MGHTKNKMSPLWDSLAKCNHSGRQSVQVLYIYVCSDCGIEGYAGEGGSDGLLLAPENGGNVVVALSETSPRVQKHPWGPAVIKRDTLDVTQDKQNV